ncbi:MAG TPA: LysM peptidoglycan-binding domain-containing protein [Actinomycetes bacterium]|nr:LysM peptidoglycan-binding domain-containing protein [Actinomycetes bacterium]
MSVNKARLASELLGIGTGGGVLQRLTIERERGEPFEALFNPHEISVSGSASWEQEIPASYAGQTEATVDLEFRSVAAETLSIELFFDTYESRKAMSFKDTLVALVPTVLSQRESTDVRRHTRKVAELVEVDQHLHRPPLCQLRWGAFDIFTGVMTSLDQRFTLFLDDGTPVRATLTCSFLGLSMDYKAKELQSSDVTKTRVVRRNDTLHSLAAEEYRDPALWRHIARANGVVNPRDLKPGTVLVIPRLRP